VGEKKDRREKSEKREVEGEGKKQRVRERKVEGKSVMGG